MAQLERADLHGEIELRFPDNTSEVITPLGVRNFLHELVDSALLAASDGLTMSQWVTLAQARAQLTLSPATLQGGQLYAIGGAWNAAGNSTVYVPALSNRAFHPQGVLFAGGIYSVVTVDVVAGTAAAVATYVPIPQDKWGLNDPPQRLATVNEALDYIHGRSATAPVNSTPTKPNWTYLSGPRTLSLAHATLAPSELEYTHDGGLTWLPYTGTLTIDNAAHDAADYIGRVKAATGRNVSPIANSPAIAAAAPTITSFTPTSGAPGSTFTITGTGFTGATMVSINSGAVASFNPDSATQITAVVGSAQASGLVRVTTPGGTAVSSTSFTVTTTTPGTPTTLTASQADYWNNGMSRPSGDYTIYSPGSGLQYNAPDACQEVTLNLARSGTNSSGSQAFSTTIFQDGVPLRTIRLGTDGVTATTVPLTGSGNRRLEVRLGHAERALEQGNIQSQVFVSITGVGLTKVAPVKKPNLRFCIGDSNTAGVGALTPEIGGWPILGRALDSSTDWVVNAYGSRQSIVGFSSSELEILGNEADNAYSGRTGTLEFLIALTGTNEAGQYFGSQNAKFSPAAVGQAVRAAVVYLRNRFPACIITVISATTGKSQEVNETTMPPYRTAVVNQVSALGLAKLTTRSGYDLMPDLSKFFDDVHLNGDGKQEFIMNLLGPAPLSGEIVRYTRYTQNTTQNANNQLVGSSSFDGWGGNGGGDKKIPVGSIIGTVLELEEFFPPASGEGSFVFGFALTTITGPSGDGSLSGVVGGIYVDAGKIAAWTGAGGQANAKTFVELGVTTLKATVTIMSDGYQINLNGNPFYKIPGTPNAAHFVGGYLYSKDAIIPASALQATALADA